MVDLESLAGKYGASSNPLEGLAGQYEQAVDTAPPEAQMKMASKAQDMASQGMELLDQNPEMALKYAEAMLVQAIQEAQKQGKPIDELVEKLKEVRSIKEQMGGSVYDSILRKLEDA